jgi:hypothetical protein
MKNLAGIVGDELFEDAISIGNASETLIMQQEAQLRDL